MNPKHIAAIEIGSSRIKGIVATALPDGRFKTLAVEEAPSGDTVRYGRIQNAREASDIINDIIKRLENSSNVAPGHIKALFIADGGRSLLSAGSEASLNFGNEEEITHRILERLQKEAMFNLGTQRDVLTIAPKRFFVDASEVKKIVGTSGSTVRGEFTLITQAPVNHRALERLVIESKGEDIKRDYVTRLLAQTEMALSDSDRQIGCLFIDFGAETTSMAAFRGGALVFAATLPIGSSNITRDLSAVLNMTFEKAENIKRTKGVAVVDRSKADAPDDETREIIDLVSARAGEIIANVTNILDQAGFSPSDFPGGIVISGGGSRLKGFPEMVEELLKSKVKTAALNNSVVATHSINVADHFDVISLAKYAAAHSDLECLVFPEKKEEPKTAGASDREAAQSAPAPVAHGRRFIKEDDPALLNDDDEGEISQPDNINHDFKDEQELPPQEDDAEKTRISLIQRIKNLMKLPVEGEDKGMDD